MTTDIIIIGGGHNALVAAFYLARAGRKPLVLERRALVGEREHAHQPASSATASAKTAVWRSTSASEVAGDISAMLWNGVIITPRLSACRCRKRCNGLPRPLPAMRP